MSTATFSESTSVRGARAREGFVNYAGAPLHTWTISLSTSQSCDGDDLASVEIDTVSSVTSVPTGTIALRAVLEQVPALPSAYARYMNAPTTAGSITIDEATPNRIGGTWMATMTVNGVATQITADFDATICR